MSELTDTTNAFGSFFIEDIQEGQIKLLVDGRTVKSEYTYPPTTYLLNVVANQLNSLRRPIYLQRIDIENLVPLNHDTISVITSPTIRLLWKTTMETPIH